MVSRGADLPSMGAARPPTRPPARPRYERHARQDTPRPGPSGGGRGEQREEEGVSMPRTMSIDDCCFSRAFWCKHFPSIIPEKIKLDLPHGERRILDSLFPRHAMLRCTPRKTAKLVKRPLPNALFNAHMRTPPWAGPVLGAAHRAAAVPLRASPPRCRSAAPTETPPCPGCSALAYQERSWSGTTATTTS
jgi:hypothetical protein